ncbi:MAG: hypothetical protein VW935_19625 [Novosphingobium sp.]
MFHDQIEESYFPQVSTRVLSRQIDPFTVLPERARRSHGRFHTHPRDNYSLLVDSAEAVVPYRPTWQTVTIKSIEPVHQVTFRKKKSTFAFLSLKNGRTQTGESYWELLRAKALEVDPAILDYQSSALRMIFSNDDGDRRYTADMLAIDDCGRVMVEEVKASWSYFRQPDYAQLMAEVQSACDASSLQLNRITGDNLESDRRRSYNISRAFDDRFAAFDITHEDLVSNAFAKSGGAIEFGDIASSLGLSWQHSLTILNALMCQRLVAYDLGECVCPDLQILCPSPTVAATADIRSICITKKANDCPRSSVSKAAASNR